MIDHLTLRVDDIHRSRLFYEKALAPLGYVVGMEYETFVGFRCDGKLDFWLAPQQHGKVPPLHLAFRAPSRAAVDAFYAAAVAAGAKDDGKPGPRPHYHQHYYAAFVLDPDGHHLEAVTHAPEAGPEVREA